MNGHVTGTTSGRRHGLPVHGAGCGRCNSQCRRRRCFLSPGRRSAHRYLHKTWTLSEMAEPNESFPLSRQIETGETCVLGATCVFRPGKCTGMPEREAKQNNRGPTPPLHRTSSLRRARRSHHASHCRPPRGLAGRTHPATSTHRRRPNILR
jgi:hypothetical protein